MKKNTRLLVLGCTLFSCTALVHASCGSAVCSVNTQWEQQGIWNQSGWRVDARFDWIDQDQPMHGDDTVSVGEIHRHHDEVRTINRNSVYSLDYANGPDWGVTVQLPAYSRDHHHVHNHHGDQIDEYWDYQEIGDLRLMGRYAIEPSAYGVVAGLKLPTGDTEVENADNEKAERTLQPGTGTTDLFAGFYFLEPSPGTPHSWFGQLLLQTALDDHDEFRPGNRVSADVGYRYQATTQLGLLAQVNLLIEGEDKGEEAEPEDSGKRSLFLSPGVSYLVQDNLQLYSFLQVPVAQFVNGVQLTADYAVSVGASVRF